MAESNGVQAQSFNLNTATFPPGKSIEGFWEFVRNHGLGTNNRVYGWGGLNRGDGTQLDPRRDIHKECGHPDDSELTPQYYQLLYDRNPVAARVVEVMARETWQVIPEIYETEDDEPTPFELAFDQVGRSLSGEKSHYRSEKHNPVFDYLRRLDEQSGIGSFGVLLFGFSDVRKGGKSLQDPCEPVMEAYRLNIAAMAQNPAPMQDEEIEGLPEDELIDKGSSDGNKTGTKTDGEVTPKEGGETEDSRDKTSQGLGDTTSVPEQHTGLKLLYLRVFPQSLVQITQWDRDQTSPRHLQPTMYLITINDPKLQTGTTGPTTNTVSVHWTRVLHVADNLSSSEVFGVPRMKPVLNELLNIDKVLASSPEMMYRGALPGISFETHPVLGGDVRINAAALKDMYEQYINSMDRVIVTSGMTAKSLAPSVVDPTPHFNVQVEAICIKIPIPKRIFMGSERGELASIQDDDSWNDTVKGREHGHATCNIVVKFVDRLINATVLPVPENGYYASWPDITSASAQQKATVAMSTIQALSTYFTGELPNHLNPIGILTNVFKFTEEEAYALLGGGMSDDTDEEQIEYDDEEALPTLGKDDGSTEPNKEVTSGLPDQDNPSPSSQE
jgi:hypothetical protein